MRVAGEKVDPQFLFDKQVRDFSQFTMNSFESMRQIANSGLNPIKFGEPYEVDYAPAFEVKSILQDADYYAELIEKLSADNFDLKSK